MGAAITETSFIIVGLAANPSLNCPHQPVSMKSLLGLLLDRKPLLDIVQYQSPSFRFQFGLCRRPVSPFTGSFSRIGNHSEGDMIKQGCSKKSTSNCHDNGISGVQVIPVSSWDEFHKEVVALTATKRYIWRGQQEDLPLKSTFDRCWHGNEAAREKVLGASLKRFRDEMSRSHPQVPLGNDDNVWALGQHYGLKSPLLDRTQSPYIAAYFAFAGRADSKERYRYIYALERGLRRLIGKPSCQRFVEFIEDLDYPSPRFSAQESIFTKAKNGADIETNVRRFARKRPGQILVKFQIPAIDREGCLRALEMMNINYGSLLLDLRDVVDRCDNKPGDCPGIPTS